MHVLHCMLVYRLSAPDYQLHSFVRYWRGCPELLALQGQDTTAQVAQAATAKLLNLSSFPVKHCFTYPNSVMDQLTNTIDLFFGV